MLEVAQIKNNVPSQRHHFDIEKTIRKAVDIMKFKAEKENTTITIEQPNELLPGEILVYSIEKRI